MSVFVCVYEIWANSTNDYGGSVVAFVVCVNNHGLMSSTGSEHITIY